MATFTLTGTFAHQDAAQTPIVGSKIKIIADPYPFGSKILGYGKTVATDANGQISVALTTGITGLSYVVRSLAKVPVFQPIRFLAPSSGTIDVSALTIYNPSGTPPPLQDINNALAAAQAAVSSVKIGTWQATTAYVTDQTVQAPDGSLIKSLSSRTSRASFDATEQGNWTPVSVKTGTLEKVALDAIYVAKGDATANLRDQAGVVGDGVADDTAAINTAIAAAAALGVRVFARGTFKIGSTVTIAGNVDLADATFNYTGTAVAVLVGTSTSGANITGKTVRLPDVVFVNKPGTGWTAGTIGVQLKNLVASTVYLGRVSGFEDGLYVYGLGAGSAWNTLVLRHLDNNKRNMRFGGDATGFSNQNTIVGGRCSHNSSEGTQVTGTRHVLIDNITSVVNNNMFFGTSLESPNVVEYHVECFGWDNVWYGCRWENTTVANTRVFWRAGSRGNKIDFGFGSQNIVEVVEAGNANTANSVAHKQQQRWFSGSATSGLLLENNASSASPVARVMPAGAYTAGSAPATAYCWEWTASGLVGKRTGDATSAPRVVLDAVNGVVRVTAAVTGSRPSAATVGAGAMFYDTTLSKPIWSNGTVWKLADGTTV